MIVKNFDKNLLVNTILISSAFYLFFITVKDFFTKKFKNISQNIAHFGFSLLILSILFNNLLSSEVITNLKIGESYDQNDLNRILKDIYDTKFFSDVTLEIKDGVLIIDVTENNIKNNKYIIFFFIFV